MELDSMSEDTGGAHEGGGRAQGVGRASQPRGFPDVYSKSPRLLPFQK